MPARLRDGLLLGGAVLALAVIGWAVFLYRPSPPPPSPPAATAPSPCADAVSQVQQYQPPGQRLPLLAQLTLELHAREPTGYHADGWLPPETWTTGVCRVRFRYQARNQAVTLTWHLDRRSGRVEAQDDRTRDLSGW